MFRKLLDTGSISEVGLTVYIIICHYWFFIRKMFLMSTANNKYGFWKSNQTVLALIKIIQNVDSWLTMEILVVSKGCNKLGWVILEWKKTVEGIHFVWRNMLTGVPQGSVLKSITLRDFYKRSTRRGDFQLLLQNDCWWLYYMAQLINGFDTSCFDGN